MAAAVANAFMRSILGRSPDPPTSPNQPSQAPRVLPGGLIFEYHEDADDNPQSPFSRRRSSAYTTHSNEEQQQRQRQSSSPPPPPALDAVDANPLSVATAVIGLIAASNRTFYDAHDINFAPRTHTASLQRLLLALKSFKLTVQLLYKWLRRFEAQTLPFPDRSAMVELDTLIVILAEATEAVAAAGGLLVDVVREATTAATRISEVVPEHAASIVHLSERIGRVDHLISKLLTIFQISSLPEAVSARAAIDAALPLIMGENPVLAESIRAMPDVFSARALVPPARLAALLNRPPPDYSVPGPGSTQDTPPLPDYSAATADNTHPDGSVTIRPLGWSVFASLTMADVGILSLVPLPFSSAELARYGDVYTDAFSKRVDPQLAELMELSSKAKAARLAKILGLRTEAAVGMADNENFARRVGLEMEHQGRDGRPRVQPNLIIGGP